MAFISLAPYDNEGKLVKAVHEGDIVEIVTQDVPPVIPDWRDVTTSGDAGDVHEQLRHLHGG